MVLFLCSVTVVASLFSLLVYVVSSVIGRSDFIISYIKKFLKFLHSSFSLSLVLQFLNGLLCPVLPRIHLCFSFLFDEWITLSVQCLSLIQERTRYYHFSSGKNKVLSLLQGNKKVQNVDDFCFCFHCVLCVFSCSHFFTQFLCSTHTSFFYLYFVDFSHY